MRKQISQLRNEGGSTDVVSESSLVLSVGQIFSHLGGDWINYAGKTIEPVVKARFRDRPNGSKIER